jgi:hypothetical protein
MTYLTWAVIFVASGAIACASNNQPAAARSSPAAVPKSASPIDTASPNINAARVLAGCYSLAIGAWSDERGPGWYVTIPSRIHLDTARLEPRRRGFEFVAQTLDSVRGRLVEQRPAWSPVGTDSLQLLGWANGTSSVNLFLRRRTAGKLEGIARYFWDQIFLDPVTKRWLWERYPTAPATLTAVACA